MSIMFLTKMPFVENMAVTMRGLILPAITLAAFARSHIAENAG